MSHVSGRHFLQIPGPSPVPDRVLRAMSAQVIDHRGPEFAELGLKALSAVKTIFKTEQHVVIYPASGTGAWEAALANVLQEGDRVLMYETGHFATLWKKMAEKLGVDAEFIGGDWRSGADANQIEQRLRGDAQHQIKAVCVVHNETSTGSVSPIADVRRAMDAAGHPALLMVDTISGLGSIDFRFDEWGVDVAVSGSQKGLMLPPGISFNAVGHKALEMSRTGGMRRSYWDWQDMVDINAKGYFPYTPATNMLYGLVDAVDMMLEEGLDTIFARHQRHAAATRAAVRAWDLEVLCNHQGHESGVLTAVLMPAGQSADHLRAEALKHYNISLGSGLSKVADKVFRIGHLGDINDLTLIGALAGVELALEKAGVAHSKGGVGVAMQHLADNVAPGIAA
ncbi:pyridoxal-phosphate-dependent aminotransferase family protein [Paracoccus sp. Ld10]|uniref:pyridoxal-phosphate-dependent aminotransferase family protein n=1 Tax=Paracoccus sp. Ld10 TaxID=649158 RepID=UPI003870E12F